MTIHPRRKQAIAAFPSGAMVIVDLNCPSNARAARTAFRARTQVFFPKSEFAFGVGCWAFLSLSSVL